MRWSPALVTTAFCLALTAARVPSAAAWSVTPPAEPGFAVAAKAAVLAEPESGAILYALNEEERLPPASVSKIMTMLLIMEAVDGGRASLDDPVTSSAAAAGTGGSQVYLKEGEVFSLRKLLIAIAVESANDASTAAAEHLYSTEEDFVRLMNARARRLGMKNTHFANAHGLPDEDHYMSAGDIAVAARELILRHPRILRYTSIWTYTFRPDQSELRNTNELIHYYRGADGLKTGHTDEAGWCLVGTAKRGGMRLLSVVMGAESNASRLRETKRLFDYGFRNFERLVVAGKGKEVGRVPVRDAWGKVRAVAPADLVAVIPRGGSRLVAVRLRPAPEARAPLGKGAVVGYLEVVHRGRTVSRHAVVAAGRVGRANLLVRGWRVLWAWVRRRLG